MNHPPQFSPLTHFFVEAFYEESEIRGSMFILAYVSCVRDDCEIIIVTSCWALQKIIGSPR